MSGRAENVLLVNMPFGSVRWPSLALGSLKAVLEAQGVRCDVRYFTFSFAALLGFQLYTEIAENGSAYSDLLGEWIFTSALYGHDEAKRETYLREVLSDPATGRYLRPELREQTLAVAREAYDAAPDFIERCFSQCEWGDYRIVGFSSVYQQNVASLALARRIKAAHPDIVIVFGGANCEGVMGLEILRQFPQVDWVNNGEGERSFAQAVQRELAGEPLHGIDGIVTREAMRRNLSGDAQLARRMQLVTDLDALPFPNHDDFFEQHRASALEMPDDAVMMTFETSRGCWWGQRSHCTFCGLNHDSMGYRAKSADRALAELRHLASRYPCRRWQVVDDILSLDYFRSFLPMLAEDPVGVELFYETKANLKKDEVKLLAEAGVVHIQPGIESLSSEVLRLMRKGVSGIQNIQLLKWCRELGVNPHWNMLFGFPAEDPAEYREMAAFMPKLYHLKPPDGATNFRLDRFSPMFEKAAEMGIEDVRVARPYHFVYALPEDVLSRLAYAFHHRVSSSVPVSEYTREVKEQVSRWREMHEESALILVEGQGHHTVFDTRPCAREPAVRLDEAQRQLLELCDSRKPKTRVQSFIEDHLPDRGPAVYDDLVDRGWLLELDGSVLSLVVPTKKIHSRARRRLRELMSEAAA
jgi:ribosomal peptide maturation radical SAM protein 1